MYIVHHLTYIILASEQIITFFPPYQGFMGDSIDIQNFLTTDITRKLITNFSFTVLDDDEMIKFYKVQPRAQVSLTHDLC